MFFGSLLITCNYVSAGTKRKRGFETCDQDLLVACFIGTLPSTCNHGLEGTKHKQGFENCDQDLLVACFGEIC